MVTVRDAHDDWFEHDGRSDEPHERWAAGSRGAPRLELVDPGLLVFETVAPRSFEAAQTVADRLREGRSVVLDLHGCDPGLAGRLTDFASGLVYALDATLQHVGDDVLLLSPGHVELSGDECAGVRSPGFYNRI